jgi:hypothetical protein
MGRSFNNARKAAGKSLFIEVSQRVDGRPLCEGERGLVCKSFKSRNDRGRGRNGSREKKECVAPQSDAAAAHSHSITCQIRTGAKQRL